MANNFLGQPSGHGRELIADVVPVDTCSSTQHSLSCQSEKTSRASSRGTRAPSYDSREATPATNWGP
ncbi:hypothetical protein TNCV_1120961 [Trichonephila clavipes]|uniref:Uncharacterized protein n=1 Tax=Trichonephila clavipes TaxID=2585209 RepID=A0A8X6T3X2_TRICX|nr:hypothetical protein TNCV_1120961 [Trichonephila clavipes]